jgi:hypothetical protein
MPPADEAGLSASAGELPWTEPFTTGHCVFICASPQAEDAAVWKTLREIQAGCNIR